MEPIEEVDEVDQEPQVQDEVGGEGKKTWWGRFRGLLNL